MAAMTNLLVKDDAATPVEITLFQLQITQSHFGALIRQECRLRAN